MSEVGKIYSKLDETIHQRARLAIMASLSAIEEMDFNQIKSQLSLTDGNLSTHAAALERAGFITISKSFVGKKPRTTLAMTQAGRNAMSNYINILQQMLNGGK